MMILHRATAQKLNVKDRGRCQHPLILMHRSSVVDNYELLHII